MNFDKIYGTPKFPLLSASDIRDLKQSAIRSSIQYYTLQGYISENRMIRYLSELPNITNVTRIPDRADGHGGDVSFKFDGVTYTMEIKTLSLRDGKGTVHLKPTRRAPNEPITAYRFNSFDFVGVCVSSRRENGLIFARANELPPNKSDSRFIRSSMVLKESLGFSPFTLDLPTLLG